MYLASGSVFVNMANEYFKNKFNTELNAKENAVYQQWLAAESKVRGKDMSREDEDYDLRGYWKSMVGTAKPTGEKGHLTDTWKKPNHPTFSTGSMYHGMPDPSGGSWEAGKWTGSDQAGWSFEPSESMLKKTHNPRMLEKYFAEREPNSILVLPVETSKP